MLQVLPFLLVFAEICFGDHKVYYMECQRTAIANYDRNYFRNLSYTSKRFRRDNPVYFLSLTGQILKHIDNTVKISFYFYELLSNVYKRSFIEVHSYFCDFMKADNIFSRAVKSTDYNFLMQCPLPPGYYHLYNMTAPYGPFLKTFPFKQGRMWMNFTRNNRDIGCAYCDVKIKEISAKEFFKYINHDIQ